VKDFLSLHKLYFKISPIFIRVAKKLLTTIGLGDGRELLLVKLITNVKLKTKSTSYEKK